MGFWDKFAGAGLAAGLLGLCAWGIKSSIEDRKEEEKRKNTPFCFPTEIPQETFSEIVFSAIKQLKKKKIDIEIDSSIIYGTVTSQSGLSSWNFTIDFNDYGSLTGRYWLKSENDDSLIPKHIADYIQEEIQGII